MPVSDDYIVYIKDMLAAFEPLRAKRMFGGVGIYSNEWFFAIMVDDVLYLKVDDANRGEFEAQGLKPFSYTKKTGVTASMSYYPVPADALEDPDELSRWVQGALQAARSAR